MNQQLPKLTEKQQKFVLLYMTNGFNASEAYRGSYDCKNSSDETIQSEASKLLKNPKVAPWIKQAENNRQEVFNDEIKYSIKDCFDELERIRNKTEDYSKTVSTALKAVELKGKLAGHFVDRQAVASCGLEELLGNLK